MKTQKSKLVAAALLGAASLGFVSSTVAGPGPQYWTQQRAKGVAAAEAKERAKMSCTSCKDSSVTRVHAGMAGGKVPARTEVIGAKHTCAACGGEIKTVQGKTTNNMTSDCSICAKAEPNCCKISG